MFKNNLKILFLISFGVILYAGLMNLGEVFSFIQNVIGLIYPILLGMLIAFILNVPMTKIEKEIEKICVKTHKQLTKKQLHSISLLITLFLILLIIGLAITLVVPALVTSVKSIYPLFQEKWPLLLDLLSQYQIDVSLISDWLSQINLEELSANAGSIFGNAVDAATSTVSSLTNMAFGMVIAIYTLIHKSTLERNFKKLLQANFNDRFTHQVLFVANLVNQTYSKFILGQCVEAIILGTLICIAFSLFQLPYAILIGFLTTIFAFIPYVGAFASLFIGALLIVLVDPTKMITSIIVYMSIQFIENQLIYPHVVGGSVGLDPLWTLLAALVGGKLFGLPGIILFIPFVAVLYELIRIDTNQKLKNKSHE